mgnify:FL=1
MLTRSGKTVDIISTSVRLDSTDNEYILAKVEPEEFNLSNMIAKTELNYGKE